MSAAVTAYRDYMRKREAARARGDVDAEDAILEEMDVLWWDMLPEERSALDTAEKRRSADGKSVS